MGGIVFRVVTPDHPGDPALDAAGAPAIRTEYIKSENPDTWTVSRDEALWFERHLDAENKAKYIGPRCHACVAAPPDEVKLPERLQPMPETPAKPKAEIVRPIKIDKRRWAELKRDPQEVDP